MKYVSYILISSTLVKLYTAGALVKVSINFVTEPKVQVFPQNETGEDASDELFSDCEKSKP